MCQIESTIQHRRMSILPIPIRHPQIQLVPPPVTRPSTEEICVSDSHDQIQYDTITFEFSWARSVMLPRAESETHLPKRERVRQSAIWQDGRREGYFTLKSRHSKSCLFIDLLSCLPYLSQYQGSPGPSRPGTHTERLNSVGRDRNGRALGGFILTRSRSKYC